MNYGILLEKVVEMCEGRMV